MYYFFIWIKRLKLQSLAQPQMQSSEVARSPGSWLTHKSSCHVRALGKNLLPPGHPRICHYKDMQRHLPKHFDVLGRTRAWDLKTSVNYLLIISGSCLNLLTSEPTVYSLITIKWIFFGGIFFQGVDDTNVVTGSDTDCEPLLTPSCYCLLSPIDKWAPGN